MDHYSSKNLLRGLIPLQQKINTQLQNVQAFCEYVQDCDFMF